MLPAEPTRLLAARLRKFDRQAVSCIHKHTITMCSPASFVELRRRRRAGVDVRGRD